MPIGQKKAANFRGTDDYAVVSKAMYGCKVYDEKGELDTKATADVFIKRFLKKVRV